MGCENYDYGTYTGYSAENFIAQQLIGQGEANLFNWQEGKNEVEFLLPYQDQIIPIEVKSGRVTRSQSFDNYRAKYHPKYAFKFSANIPHVNLDNSLIQLPLYLIEKFASTIV